MSYFRSYFEKNNTIIKNSRVNTAKNPTTEIFYGTLFSRFIFKIDLTELKNKVTNGDLVVTSGTTHTLHLTNTIFGDDGLKGQHRSTGKERASSFELELFKLNEHWYEGIGFDYAESGYDFTAGNKTFSIVPSNWYKKNSLDDWSTEGAYNGTGTTITQIQFDNGNEDINVDISDYINGIILSGNTDYGLGLKFVTDYENITSDINKSVAFFTKYTQTFFEPYLETNFVDKIDDSRQSFIEGIPQNLYLYVMKGNNSYDLDTLPTVDIINVTGGTIESLSGMTATKIKKGVYKTTFTLNNINADGKKFYYDKWYNLIVDGTEIADITQKFIPKSNLSFYTIGGHQKQLNRYSVQFFGIKLNEKIKRGEIRKITVQFRNINISIADLFDTVYYRIYIKEGKLNVNVHDWTEIDKTNENSFYLDTSYLIPREYHIEIKAKLYNEEIFYPNDIKFEIISER